MREALRKHLGPDDWEQQVLIGKQSLPIPDIAKIEHGHISVKQIRPHLDEEIWDSYFKFGFVRNPFDRFVSTCFFLNRENPGFAADAATFMNNALDRPKFRQRILVQPQHLQLSDDAGHIALDLVGRYENLQSSYDEICERTGIPTASLPRKNVSRHAGFTSYYDDGLRARVAEFYEQDLQQFDYDFPSS